ncbi:MAG TPA: hypothetical protein PKO06_09985, partial [Candidatus Ozemobacteraceae bacterium]|nr:hypothetical protein [Candidatus Ozemobacteraceae bacterium]
KMQLRPPQAPKEFIGVQSQISVNRGGPYQYFVIITKPELKLKAAAGSDQDVVNLERKPDVHILVVRQVATKTGGYQTNASDVSRLVAIVKQSVEKTLEIQK